MFDQFVSGDMARIRNKGAYLWGIVRNVNSGSGRSKGVMPFGADDDSAASGVDGGMKMLWPEEEQVLSIFCCSLILGYFSVHIASITAHSSQWMPPTKLVVMWRQLRKTIFLAFGLS